MKMFINHGIHRLASLTLAIFGMALSSYAGAVEATSPVFGLSLKHDGVRQSVGVETLTYSSQWDGGDGATVTIAENGAVVADGLSGEGAHPWSVQKTGEYTLTHTTYTNGIAGKVETAKFVVPGPELTFEYDGGPFVGGKVTINGNLDGWTIYYTLDGSTPTTESLKYTGPFTLSSAANLKAYAVSDSGMSTPLIENNYAVVERARIENVRARQRWPWNGKVDIDFDVVGDVTLGVPDGTEIALLVTATNRMTGMVYIASTSSLSGDIDAKEGVHCVVWDMSAQGLNFKSDEVVFSVGYIKRPELYCILDLSGGVDADSYTVSYLSSPPSGEWSDEYKTTKLVMRFIQPGTFIMGSERGSESLSDNRPHLVTITKPYYIGVFEVTQRQYELIMGKRPSYFTNETCYATRPVEKINYDMLRGDFKGIRWPISAEVDSWSFLGILRNRIGSDNYDLPTEAQWEYACRAGTTTDYNNGKNYVNGWIDSAVDDICRYINNCGLYGTDLDDSIRRLSLNGTASVGLYSSNAWGIYDMHGNVMEWCLDRYDKLSKNDVDPKGIETGDYRVLRGGSWAGGAAHCTSDVRYYGLQKGVLNGNNESGFRLVRSFSDEENKAYLICSADTSLVKIDSLVGLRSSLGAETLTYSSQWDGGDGATVTIAQDGAVVADSLSGEGTRPWSVTRNGTYVLTHTTYTNGIAGKVETATFVVTGKDVAFAADDVTIAGFTGKYDGAAHGVGVTVKDGIEDVAFKYAVSQTGEPPVLSESWSNEFPTITDVGAMTVWCEIAAPGYITQTNSATVVISPREVTLTSGSANKVYDGTALVNGNVTVGGDGFVGGEGASYNVTGSQTNVGESENVFIYTLNDSTKASNYNITTVNGKLTVTKANVGGGTDGGEEPGNGEVPTGGLSKFDASFVYDGEGHTIDTNALVAAFGSVMVGASAIEYAVDDGTGESPVLPWLETTPVYTNAGEYVVWYRVTNPNYEDFVHAAKLSITKRLVTVSVAGHTATCAYDTTEKTVSGYDIVTDDELYDVVEDTVFSGANGVSALPSAVRTDVGTTAMGLSVENFANKNENFEVTYLVSDGWLKIEPRIIGDDPANWDIRLARNPMYDGTEQSAPITQVAFVKPDGNLDYIPYELSGNTATDSGNYVVRITGTGNYSGTVEKEWAITPRNVTLSSGSAEWVYDGEAHSQSAVSVTGDGFAAGEGASYSAFPIVRHVADAVAPRSNTFEYALNANTKAQNYVITTVNGTVKMSPRAVTLTAPTKQKQYDGTPLTFGADEIVTTLTNGGQGLPALPNGEAFTLGDFASITEAGRVDATFTVADGTALMADYAITVVPGTLTVMKNATEITVTAKSGSWVYDGAAHTLHEYEATNLGVLQSGDALEVTFSDESVVTTPIDGEAQNGVVANVITSVRVIRNGKDDVTANYTLAPYNGTLTVTKRPVTLTSKSAEKVYDGEPLTAHEVEVGGDGFVGEDGATYVFTGSQTEKGKSKNTFTYSLKGGTNAAFYDITKVEGELEVTALDIAGGNDEDWEIVLGPALTYTGLEQIQTLASVCYKGLPVDYSVTGNAATDAGLYSMTLTGQGNFSGEKAVSWSIAPKALTLTAGSGSRVYDGTPFTVGAVTAVGFVAGEGAQYECDGAQKDVGSSVNDVSVIRWNANTKGGNYTVTKVAGTLTVTPRPVTLTAANISKPYDGTPLTLTAADIAADGLVAGESFIYSNFASRTEAGQTPATFDYVPGPGTSLANYTVTVTPGRTITITKSATAISVTAASETWVYDGEEHSNRTWTATNLDTLQAGDALEVMFDEASVVTTPQDGLAQDGVVANVITSVRVIRNGTDDVTANYTVEWFPGTLTVTKRPVTVAVTGNTATYTYDGTEKTVTGFDLATEDTLYDVMGKTYFGGVSFDASRTNVGTSQMNLAESQFANSDEKFEVTYVVTDGYVKIEPLDISEAAEDEFAITLGANPKYNGTVQTIPVASVTCGGLPVTYTLAGENATHAGTYTLTVKANGNFMGERSTTWQVLKRSVTLTSASATKVYDGSPLINQNVTVGGDGFIGIEGAIFDVTGSQTVAGSSKNTFTYSLKAGTLSGDYDITKIEGDLTVTKATYPGQEAGGAGIKWSVAADAATWMYDGKTHEVTLTGVPAGVTAHISGNTAKDAGEYTASVTFDYDEANFNAPVIPAPLKWTITKRPIVLTVTGKTATFTYDKAEKFVEGYDIVSGDTLYDISAGTVFSGTAKAVRTVVGTTQMELRPTQFSNMNNNFTVTYAVTDGWVKIEKSTFNPQDVFGGNGSEENPLVCEKVYDGSAQSVEIKPNFNEEYRFLWSLTKGDETSYSEIAPTLRNVADGELTVYFKFVTENYEPYYGKVIFRILPKTLTDEMVVLTDEAFFYDPGSTVKKPSVTVSDTNAVGVVISTIDDYTVVYDEATSAGAIPVTVTGKNNYTGTVTKTFDVLKRPVAPPVIGSKSYNAKNQTATIPVDERWMVVKNDGGINAGEYEVMLRLRNSNDYMWKGTDGKSADWTGVFVITRSANGWSRAPGITNWTEGETPSEPVMGTPRRGTTSYVTYRKRGADVSTAVREKPTRAGKYTARFVVEESENYVGTYRDVDFEILPGVGGFTETQTTPVPVPYAWLEKYLAKYGEGDYESAGNAKGANGVSLWESYVAGLDPDDATSKFTARIEMGADGKAVVTWTPDLSKDEKPRKYTTLGKEKLGDDAWSPVTDGNKAKMRFFKVTVEMK